MDRLSDARVQQFWDPKHEVSKELARMAASQPSEPRPNSSNGFYWDQAILYAPQAEWQDAPKPLFWQGPVYQVPLALQHAIGAAEQTPVAQRKN